MPNGRGASGDRGPSGPGPRADLEAVVDVAAPPDAVWDAIADPARMSRWSPECIAVRVLGRPGPGTRTVNLNRRGWVVWPTTSTLVRYEPGREIAWSVPASGTVWSMAVSAHGDGSRVVHRREVPAGVPWVSRAFARVLLGGAAGHDDELAQDMHATLAALQRDVENR